MYQLPDKIPNQRAFNKICDCLKRSPSRRPGGERMICRMKSIRPRGLKNRALFVNRERAEMFSCQRLGRD